MLREMVTRPVSAAVALVELPLVAKQTLEEANELLAASRRKIEDMDRQTNDAIEQAERMNDLLARVVKLTEPLEMAQRGGDLIGGALKRAIFGDEPLDVPRRPDARPADAAIEAEVAPEIEVVEHDETVPASDGVHSASAAPAETEPTPEPVPEPAPQPVPEPAPDPVPEPVPDPQPEPAPGPQAVSQPEDEADSAQPGEPGDRWRPRGDLRAVPDPPQPD